ncbi:hypothetical protein SSS_10917 [Sarcoptes scabiei]|nr:hypothetical protein SSS_10917 [Sarcoptes scabiei]
MPNSRTDEISPLSSSIDRSSLNNSLIVNEDSNGPDANSDGILGRGKRKRVMPSRYDDNEIDLIPMNKRNKFNNQQRESHSNSNSNDAFSPHSKTSGHTPKSVSSERRKVLPVQPIHSGGIEMKSENDEKEYIASNSSFKEDYADKDRSLKMKIVKQSNGNRRIDTNSNEDFHSNETKAKKIPIILKNHPSMKALSLN